MRLDRYISHATGRTRSRARSLVRAGRVAVGGATVRDVGFDIGDGASVTCDGVILALPGPLYLMLHKPCGVVSATRDGRHATVSSLLPAALAARVHLVGRLDKDTSGLLLLSDDGAWSHRISAPARRCPKTYVAELAQALGAAAQRQLGAGVMLRNDPRLTRPARVELLNPARVRITITEGRYHQVRRMFAAVGNRVLALHRERIGGLALDPGLAAGQWRELTPAECALVFSHDNPV